MQQFQSLQRLLLFHALTLLVMLSLYYFTLFYEIKNNSEQQSIDVFYSLQHEINKHAAPLDTEITEILNEPIFEGISYQLIFMMPSGQTHIHRYARPNESAFATVNFPIINSSSFNDNSHSAYTINSRNLTGTIRLKSGHHIYIILRHKPIAFDWISYRYWLPLVTAMILFLIALIYMLTRRTNWEQLLRYTDDLSSHAKAAYRPPPFLHKKSTTEFLHLGHALSRISYQLHSDYRRIKTLTHRIERLVNQSPLPMLMIMRHGQISFFNPRFEQAFISFSQKDSNYELTDFFVGKDESTQLLLQNLSNLRLTRTLTVYELKNKQVYQLHITPWFSEHGQVHGFTVLLNNINELANQTEQLQQKNQKMKQKLDELNKVRSLMGYQLRIPLETMIDLLEPIDPTTLTAERSEVLKSLITASQSMLTMLNDTLNIGEIEVRKTRLHIEPVDIYKLGQEMSHLLINDIRQQGLDLIYFFAPDSPRCIDTDDIRLRQILLDLLKNAIKFTTSGYVALTIDCVTKAQITQINGDHLLPFSHNKVAEECAHWIRFSIRDTGIGIAVDKQNQLLTKFHQNNSQANAQPDQSMTATGMGLNNANSFAQLLGGFIELKSTIDKGSTFTLYLPCRNPNYQSVYHLNHHLTQVHLIAVLNQGLAAKNLQRLCDYLSIPVTIYTDINTVTIQKLIEQPPPQAQTHALILLLDYEYYESKTLVSSEQAEGHSKAATNNKRQTINNLIAHTSIPKILLSMKPERRIPSVLLDKYEGFLSKPLEMNLLLSEILRLTSPTRQKLMQPASLIENSSPLIILEDNAVSPTLSPLILVVEDSLTNQKITCKMLDKLGYRSVVAEDGQQALEQLKQQRQDISLILMDCRMPVMDGLQATQAIRAQGDDIPIVALTANDTKEDRDACLQVGMDEFLTKPINKKALETILQRFIES